MIARLVAFGLHQRFVTLALALLLTAGGMLSWTRLPIEAYPDVGDVTVEVITLWPGHAAEEVERLITIQLEKELNGVANVTFLRSASLFGLSNGCQIRFRPIVVSGIVAVIGFLPAALSHGIGAEIQRPLARVVIGGLISSTLLTLLVLPAIYAWLGGAHAPAPVEADA